MPGWFWSFWNGFQQVLKPIWMLSVLPQMTVFVATLCFLSQFQSSFHLLAGDATYCFSLHQLTV
jgi:hypothetical protein